MHIFRPSQVYKNKNIKKKEKKTQRNLIYLIALPIWLVGKAKSKKEINNSISLPFVFSSLNNSWLQQQTYHQPSIESVANPRHQWPKHQLKWKRLGFSLKATSLSLYFIAFPTRILLIFFLSPNIHS